MAPAARAVTDPEAAREVAHDDAVDLTLADVAALDLTADLGQTADLDPTVDLARSLNRVIKSHYLIDKFSSITKL